MHARSHTLATCLPTKSHERLFRFLLRCVLLRAVAYRLSLLLQSKVELWEEPCALEPVCCRFRSAWCCERFRVVLCSCGWHTGCRARPHTSGRKEGHASPFIVHCYFIRDVAVRKEGVQSDLFCSNSSNQRAPAQLPTAGYRPKAHLGASKATSSLIMFEFDGGESHTVDTEGD